MFGPMPNSGLDMTIEFERPRAPEAPPRRIVLGLALSSLLHILAALLIFLGLPGLMQPVQPPALPMAISVNLVRLGPESGALTGRQIAALAQETPATSNQAPPNPAPLLPSPPHAVFSLSQSGLPSNRSTALPAQTNQKLLRLKPRLTSSFAPQPAVKPKAAPPAVDLQAQLQTLAQQQQLQAQQRTNRTQQSEQGSPNVTPDTSEAAPGSPVAYKARDFIRAQIERHWYLDRAAAGAGDFVISLRLQLQSDGRVASAEIIDGQSLDTSEAYRSAASSLRAAALVSSPLALPPGAYEAVKDIELTFRPKDVFQ